jgi:cytochrome P450
MLINSFKSSRLQIYEIKLNMIQFLVAGYETTAVTISSACYILATKPEDQQKLQDEIDSNIDPNVRDFFLLAKLSFKK